MSNELPKTRAEISRRTLLKGVAAAGAFTIIPSYAAPQGTSVKPGSELPPSDRVNLAIIGMGGQGTNDIKTLHATGHCNIVALCDADLNSKPTQELLKLFPKAAKFQDFRQMFDKMAAQIDAVVIATPDHSHFPIAMQSMAMRKHVFVEKPLAHSFQEIDLLMAAEQKYKVAAQMGNQGHSGANYFQFKSWTEAGVIKDVTKVHAFMNSARVWHGWTINAQLPAEPVPNTLNWDLWTGTAEMRPFNSKYHPYSWRSFFPYGTGAFGDWGAHILDTIHQFLELGLPEEVEAVKRDGASKFIFPQASTIAFRFPARGTKPPLEITWFDGKENLPPRPAGLEAERQLPSNGKILFSKTLTFLGGTHSDTLRILPEAKMKEMAGRLPRITGQNSDHYLNFLLACKGKERCRSPFQVSGPLTQVFLLGILAQRLGGTIKFDRQTRRVTNNKEADALLAVPPRKGWESYYKL
jgi:predicted dehydrogenase